LEKFTERWSENGKEAKYMWIFSWPLAMRYSMMVDEFRSVSTATGGEWLEPKPPLHHANQQGGI